MAPAKTAQPKKLQGMPAGWKMAVGCVVICICAGAYMAWPSAGSEMKARKKRAFTSYELNYPNMCLTIGQIALVYAEGPAAGKTIPIAQQLNARKLSGSFFPVAKLVNDVTTVTAMQYLASSNQFIGMRFATDLDPTNMSQAELQTELCFELKKMYSHVSKYPKYIMLPAGQVDAKTDALVKSMGMVPITWNLDSQDYATAASGNCDTITSNFLKSFAQLPLGWGKWIALLHDIYQCTSDTTPSLLNTIASYNYTVVPMDQCLNDKTPYLAQSTVDAFCGSSTVSTGSTSPPPSSSSSSTTNSGSTASTGSTSSTKSSAKGSMSNYWMMACIALVALVSVFMTL